MISYDRHWGKLCLLARIIDPLRFFFRFKVDLLPFLIPIQSLLLVIFIMHTCVWLVEGVDLAFKLADVSRVKLHGEIEL
jgi:hypothetical protein